MEKEPGETKAEREKKKSDKRDGATKNARATLRKQENRRTSRKLNKHLRRKSEKKRPFSDTEGEMRGGKEDWEIRTGRCLE